MRKVCLALIAAIAACLLVPVVCLAAVPKTFSGTVIKIYGSGVVFKSTSAATYSADLANAVLTRKNGAAMKLEEILIGDKVNVIGTLWADNSISATSIKDMSLYAHTGTFTGKITGINPAGFSFTLESKQNGDQTIYTNNFTSFSKNGSNAGFQDLQLAMTATIKGVWDRSNTTVTASMVAGNFRMIAIYFIGTLSVRNVNALTVIGNGNVIYGVDAGNASILSKNGKAMNIAEYKQGDTLRVWGKHISGMVAVTASEVKDASVTK